MSHGARSARDRAAGSAAGQGVQAQRERSTAEADELGAELAQLKKDVDNMAMIEEVNIEGFAEPDEGGAIEYTVSVRMAAGRQARLDHPGAVLTLRRAAQGARGGRQRSRDPLPDQG